MAQVALCETAAVEPGTALRVDRPERLYAVFNLDGTFYVTEDTCSHGPGSLSAGYIDGDVVECDFHAGCFHIPTGNAVKAPCTIPVLTFPATVRDGKVWIEAAP
jgi:nitrite reductase/ring-hydroxylating ferredoxin subunit